MTSNASRAYRIALRVAAGLLVIACRTSFAQERPSLSPAEVCLAANQNLTLGASTPRALASLKRGDTLKIVAIGSSTTVGLWVMNSAATYPEVMRRELARLLPDVDVEIVNSGRVGDTIPGNIARFERDVLSAKPDMVIWQLGTNDVAWGGHADGLKETIVQGLRLLKASGADLILMDLQYAPAVLASSDHPKMQAIIAEVARQEQVGLFPRFALMRRAIDAGLSPGALVSWDGLHNSADGYDCIGRALARAIATSVRHDSRPQDSRKHTSGR
jgi:lysophospholipase L1-like esterase